MGKFKLDRTPSKDEREREREREKGAANSGAVFKTVCECLV